MCPDPPGSRRTAAATAGFGMWFRDVWGVTLSVTIAEANEPSFGLGFRGLHLASKTDIGNDRWAARATQGSLSGFPPRN